MTKGRFLWTLKQLVSFKYDTTFGQDGKRKITIWKMWLGRCYNIKTYELAS